MVHLSSSKPQRSVFSLPWRPEYKLPTSSDCFMHNAHKARSLIATFTIKIQICVEIFSPVVPQIPPPTHWNTRSSKEYLTTIWTYTPIPQLWECFLTFSDTLLSPQHNHICGTTIDINRKNIAREHFCPKHLLICSFIYLVFYITPSTLSVILYWWRKGRGTQNLQLIKALYCKL